MEMTRELLVVLQRSAARSVAHLWDPPPAVLEWLDTGASREEAEAAARHAAAQAWAAAEAARGRVGIEASYLRDTVDPAARRLAERERRRAHVACWRARAAAGACEAARPSAGAAEARTGAAMAAAAAARARGLSAAGAEAVQARLEACLWEGRMAVEHLARELPRLGLAALRTDEAAADPWLTREVWRALGLPDLAVVCDWYVHRTQEVCRG